MKTENEIRELKKQFELMIRVTNLPTPFQFEVPYLSETKKDRIKTKIELLSWILEEDSPLPPKQHPPRDSNINKRKIPVFKLPGENKESQVLKVFEENPTQTFSREDISLKLKMTGQDVSKKLVSLSKDGLIEIGSMGGIKGTKKFWRFKQNEKKD